MHRIQVYRDKRNLGFEESARLLRRAAKAALKAEGVEEDCIINIMLTDNGGIHEINLEQRGVDAPTDVLSFPMNELVPGEFDSTYCEYDFESDKILLGDMVLSLERCAAQAEEFGHSYARELSYLCVHSVLHLLGYDHMDEGAEKAKMRQREEAIMSIIGLDR